MRFLAVAMLLLQAQDGGRITLDRNGTVEEAAQALSKASGATIRVLDGVDPKPFACRVAKATFFEALDALCRAHGNIRYFEAPKGPDEGQIELRPGTWIDFPSCYSEDFKVVISEMAGFTGTTSVGNTRWNRVMMSLWGPPWIRVQDDQTAKTMWVPGVRRARARITLFRLIMLVP